MLRQEDDHFIAMLRYNVVFMYSHRALIVIIAATYSVKLPMHNCAYTWVHQVKIGQR